MAILGIEHVQLAMPAGREAEARAFYAGLLGLPEIAKPPELAGRGGAWFESGPVKIHLGVDAEFRAARKAHPALRVSDLGALAGRLREAGVAVVEDPLEGYLRVYVTDPFGNRLELMEERAATPAKPALPQGYRQGLVTAITVFLGFSLSFIRFWNFESAGEWTRTGVVPAALVAAGSVVQLVALWRALGLPDDEPGHYAVTVRWFFAGIVVVVVGVLIATIVAG